MNSTTESPVRPPVAPPIPAIPVGKPEPLSDYAKALRATAAPVPAIPFPKPPGPDASEPDVLKSLDKAVARMERLSKEVADYRARLKEVEAREAQLLDDEQTAEADLVDQLAKIQAQSKVLSSRSHKLEQKLEGATLSLRDRLDFARVSLQTAAESLRAQRIAGHLTPLAKRIMPGIDLLPVLEHAYDVVPLAKYIRDPLFGSFLSGRPASPELRLEQMLVEIRRLRASFEDFEAERSKQYNFD